MPDRPHTTLQEKLNQRLRFYEDLGLGPFYRDRGGTSQRIAPSVPELSETLSAAIEESTLRKSTPKIMPSLKTIVPESAAKLPVLPTATGPSLFGRAGKLLTQMIEAMGLQRRDVYICNVVKCRPPENRQPEKDEVMACSPFLFRQLDVLKPKVIVCLGSTAAQTLLQTNRGISHFRGEWLDFRGYKMLATYHPAYLLRNPGAKGEVWKDLQKVMAELGLEVKKNKAK